MTFCVIPWIHRQTDEQGFHQLCCVGVGEENELRNERGERLHISQTLTDEQVLNSPILKAVRRQMIRGEWPAACERCRQTERAGARSIRLQLNAEHGRDRHVLLRQTHEDGSLESPVVRYADIRLSNVCNLTCRMCGPYASRLWTRHFNVVQPASYRLPERTLRVLNNNSWTKTPALQWLLEQCLSTVERLHFAGGEPLVIPEMVDALQQCISSGRAAEIDLSYNTNLTVLPEKVTALWPQFRSLSVLCSLDGYGRLNDYIRRPSRWREIEHNLQTLDRRADEWKLRWAAVSTTVQIYNVLTLRDLFTYLRTAGFRRIVPIPQLVPLITPSFLSIRCLPPSAKSIARERLQAELERASAQYGPEMAPQIGSLRATIAFLDAADTSVDLPHFFSFTDATDCRFGDSWREVAPELAAILKPIPYQEPVHRDKTAQRARSMMQSRRAASHPG